MAKSRGSLNNKLFGQAKQYLVGGVSSPVRSFKYVGGQPILIDKGKGSKAYDYDGNEYIDYGLSWGALILGHAFPEVVNQVKKAAEKGLSFGTTNKAEIDLARIIHKAIPAIERVRFVNSGTEAVMGAVRVARGYTKRDKILKFRNSYHGHADYLLASAGSGLSTLSIPQSKGVPKDFVKHTIVIPYGDYERLDNVFKKYGSQIAAVLFEPAGANFGVVPPEINFLKRLRKVTKRYGALLIADEVITGFRFHFGALSLRLGIKPDLFCLGKIIGGGLPIGAYGGSKKIMEHLSPLGEVYQASTFSGNPVVMQAGLTTLKKLNEIKNDYEELESLTEQLALGLERQVRIRGIDLRIESFGSMFSFKFGKSDDFRKFYRSMLQRGVYFAPSQYEANFLSFAHTKADIELTIRAAVFKKSHKLRGGKDV